MQELWQACMESNAMFLRLYIAYAHFRSKVMPQDCSRYDIPQCAQLPYTCHHILGKAVIAIGRLVAVTK